MKTDLFQSYGHGWVFQICWHIECSTFTALSYRIWNSSTVIPSPPLALFIVMLPEAHSTSHSRMSGSRWVIIPSWLSGSWRSYLYSSSVYFCHLFLISSDLPCDSAGKESACNVENLGSIPGLQRFPWRRERLLTPVFCPREFHGLYRPWGCKESDMTERLSLSLFHFQVSLLKLNYNFSKHSLLFSR